MTFSKKNLSCFLSLLFLIPFPSFAQDTILGFESSEHIIAGDNVKIFFSAGLPAKADYKLHLPNGLQMTYGQLISMPDFYGVVGTTISSGDTEEQHEANFIKVFNTLAQSPAAVSEEPKIMDIVKVEQDTVLDAIQRGEKPEVIFSKISMDNDRKWNCATGGGCDGSWFLKPGRYMNLARQDFDHFDRFALACYNAGHAVALKTAAAAHAAHDLKQLELAYAMNAFATHFLSDHFASGHLRIPRKQLPDMVTPRDVGSLLVSAMHAEENKASLHVHNARGEHWISYGDKYYFDAVNAPNRALMSEAMQKSADEIFAAYQTGTVVHDDAVTNIIPEPDEVNNQGTQDIAPLFYWDAATNKLYRRKDVHNLYNREWTTDWWGWTTLIMIHAGHPLSLFEQAQLARSPLRNEAIQAGLITNKQLINNKS